MLTSVCLLFTMIAWLCLLATLPGTLELLLITIGYFLPRKKERSQNFYEGLLAVVIPAHNESLNIQSTLKSLRACKGKFDVVVVVDNCTDDTSKLAQEMEAKVLIRNDKDHIGKHFALQFAFNTLMEEGYTDFLIIDADTTVDPWIVKSIQNKFANGSLASQVIYTFYHQRTTTKERLLYLASVAFNWVRPLGRQGWKYSSGLFGNGFALSSKLLKAVPFQVDSIVEDLAYHLKIVEKGFHVDFINDCQVYTTSPPNSRALKIQRTRWESGRIRILQEQGFYLFKKVISGNWQLLEPLLDLLLLPLAIHTSILIILLLLPGYYTFSYALIGLFLVFIHVLIALFVGRCNSNDYLALLSAPFYIFWKLSFLNSIYKAIKNKMGWIRTER